MSQGDLLKLAVFLLVVRTPSAFPTSAIDPEPTDYGHSREPESIDPRPTHKFVTDRPLKPIYLLPDDFFPENDRDVVITWATRRNWNKEPLTGNGGLYKNLFLLRGFGIPETPPLDPLPLEQVNILYRK